MDEADFREYVTRFNEDDFEGFGSYYAEDVEFELGDRKRIVGREDVLEFYREVASRVEETLTVRDVLVDGDRIAAELETEFHALEDWPDFVGGPMKAGETVEFVSFVHYWIEDGQFRTIRSARFRTR